MQSEARLETAAPQRYIKRLCKHFAHKAEATHTENHGRVEFPFGDCEMTAEVTADPGVLILHAEADSEDTLRQVEEVVARHLKQFSRGRESLDVTWNPVSIPPTQQ